MSAHDATPSDKKKCPRYACQECGMNVEAREYHPYFFCQLKKAGIAQHDFWVTHRDLIAKSGEAGDTQEQLNKEPKR